MPGNSSHRRPHTQELPRSLPLLIARREDGRFHQRQRNAYGLANARAFVQGVARQFAPQTMITRPQLVSPPSSFSHRRQQQQTAAIHSLHVDRVEHRFVLAGGSDAIVSIYDLSKWGSEEYFSDRQNHSSHSNSISLSHKKRSAAHSNNNSNKSVHKPIASSQREPPLSLVIGSDELTTHAASLEIPSGHASPISKVQWYPVDSGAFLSSSRDGSLLVWDTDSLSPVAQCTPFGAKGIGSFHLSPRRSHSAVVASFNDPSLKLVDIRSGASSHTLLGHAHPGVSSVQWAPHTDVMLASGGIDGTIRLWDIRKAGSRACVAILNQDKTHPPSKAKAYKADYSHLPKPSAAILSSVDDSFSAAAVSSPSSFRSKRMTTGGGRGIMRTAAKRTTVNNQHVAPNNYRPTENSSVLSHNGPVSALAFGAEQDGHSLVSASQDGNIHIWDLRGNGHLLPLRFMAPGSQPAVSRHRKQVPLLLTQFSRFALGAAACWVGNGSNLLGYSLERGGMPQQVLQGHLHTITAMDIIEATMQVLTAGKDGMILTWGKPDRSGHPVGKRKVDEDNW